MSNLATKEKPKPFALRFAEPPISILNVKDSYDEVEQMLKPSGPTPLWSGPTVHWTETGGHNDVDQDSDYDK